MTANSAADGGAATRCLIADDQAMVRESWTSATAPRPSSLPTKPASSRRENQARREQTRTPGPVSNRQSPCGQTILQRDQLTPAARSARRASAAGSAG
jgi:hypothetical protein